MSRLPATIGPKPPNGDVVVTTNRPAAVPIKFTLADIQQMAEMVSRSRLFPGIGDAQAAATLMLLCQAEGLHPMEAMKRYHIIEGRPSMRADAMHAQFQARGGRVRWIASTDEVCEAHFSHPGNPDGLTVRVTLQELADSGVARDPRGGGMKANYKKFPRQMLRARCLSEGVRAIDPGAILGIYTPEEVSDFEPAGPAPAPASPLDERPPSKLGTTNHSGHGRTGLYADPETTAEFRRRADAFCEKANAAWLDLWADRRVEVPRQAERVIVPQQLILHLLKWACQKGPEDGGLAPVGKTTNPDTGEVVDRASVGMATGMVAVLWKRDPDTVQEEIFRYAAAKKAELIAKHFPEFADEGDMDAPDPEPDPAPIAGVVVDAGPAPSLPPGPDDPSTWPDEPGADG
jgi:hypothetical protein